MAERQGLDLDLIQSSAWRLHALLGDRHPGLSTWRAALTEELKTMGALLYSPNAGLVEALERIRRWHGEFPETGEVLESGDPVSYGLQYGSNGERDYMRQVAAAALGAFFTPPGKIDS